MKRLLLACSVVVFTFIALGTVASAAKVYQTTDIKTCLEGDIYINPPFVFSDNPNKKYYCVTDHSGSDDFVGAGEDQVCDAGVPSTPSQFGVLCFINKNPGTTTKDEIKRDESDIVDKKCIEKVKDGDKNACANGIYDLLNQAIAFLSAGIGIVVVIMIIVGGIQYSSAGGDPQKVAQAKSKITNALLALVAYIFLYAILDWLIPGGLLK
jgi:hypothetical protein